MFATAHAAVTVMIMWMGLYSGWGAQTTFFEKGQFFQNKKQSIKAKKGETKRTKQRGCGM